MLPILQRAVQSFGRRLAPALAAVTLVGCHRSEARQARPDIQAVLTTTVHASPAPPIVRRGIIATGSRLHLGFNAGGVLGSIKVKAGDFVHRGQVLARLHNDGASAALSAAQASKSRAALHHRTAVKLAETGSIASVETDDTQSALRIAKANVAMAAVTLNDRQLISPINGTILQQFVERGETVAPGAPVVVIDDTEHLVVRVGLAERDVVRITLGPATLLMDGSDEAIPAAVTSVGAAPLDDGLYAIEVSPAADRTRTLRPGSTLSVRFDTALSPISIRVPLDAIVYRDKKAWAFVATPEAGQTHVRLREVVVDRMDGKDVSVRSGLVEGESIVQEGGYFLEDGQTVNVMAKAR